MVKNKKKLSIIIPSYNEINNLKILLKKANKILSENKDIEIIIVDNGSTDGSKNYLYNNKKFFPRIKVVRVQKNIGYGFGIKYGLKFATGKIVSWTHADLQCEPNDILKSIHTYRKEIYNNNIIIKGKRTNRRILDNFFSICMAYFASVVFRKKFNDVNAQPKIFNRKFLKHLKKAPKDFSLDLFVLFMAKKKLYRILEYPVYYKKRLRGIAKGGDSFLGKLLLSIRTLKFIISLKIKVIWKS